MTDSRRRVPRCFGSSNIAWFCYTPDTLELVIAYATGGIYLHAGVPADIAARLQNVSSVGTYVNYAIKGVYPVIKIGYRERMFV